MLLSHSQGSGGSPPSAVNAQGGGRGGNGAPPFSPVSDGFGKECIGTDLERKSETKLQPGSGAGDRCGGISKGWSGPHGCKFSKGETTTTRTGKL